MRTSMQCLIAAAWILKAPSAWAVLFVPMSIDEMTTRAQVVIHGTVLSKSCRSDPEGRIYTQIELAVTDVWKGTVVRNPFRIVHGGGALGEERVVISGQVEYSIGEEVIAFLVINQRGEGVTLGLAQGKFRVVHDQAGGKSLVQNVFHGGGPPAEGRIELRRGFPPKILALEDLKAQVKGAEK